jgi:hypothetical protein
MSGPWLLLYWAAGTFRYMRATEKAISVLLVVFSLAAWPAVGLLYSVYKVTDDDTIRATVSALKGGYEPEKARYINRVLTSHPDDPTFHFLLASVLKDGGYFVEAFQHYRTVLELEPENHRVYNNIGNIYFATGQYGQAVNWYFRAIDVDDGFTAAYFNIYLAHNEQFHYTEAEQSLEHARGLDAGAVAGYLARAEEAAANPVDVKIPMSEAWEGVMRRYRNEAVQNPIVGATSATFWNPLTVGSVLALAAMLVLPFVGRRTRARECHQCGRAFCTRCQGAATSRELCPQCSNLSKWKGDVPPEVRAQKREQIARHDAWTRWSRRVAAAILPGAGHVLAGRSILGSVLLNAWIVLWLALLVGPRLLTFSAGPYVPGGNAGIVFTATVLLVVWLLGNLSRFSARPVARI